MGVAVVTGTAVVLPGVEDADGLLRSGSWVDGARVGPERLPTGRGMRYKDRATLLALAAADAALEDAGLLGEEGLGVSGETVGTVVSSNLGNLDTVCQVAERLDRSSTGALTALDLPNASSNVIASHMAIRFGMRGVNTTVCNGATSGLDAVGWATLAIEVGRVARVLVVGVEPVNAVLERLVDVGRPPRLLDGAGALVLESDTAAASRNRPGRAAVAGYARRRDATTAVRTAAGGVRVGLWLPPQGAGADEGAAGGEDAAAMCDLGRTLPSASGAFGVLQCVAATAWLDGAPGPPDVPRTALAVAGGGMRDDAAAAVLLTTALTNHHWIPPRPNRASGCEETQ